MKHINLSLIETGKASNGFDSTAGVGFLIATRLYPIFGLDDFVDIVSFVDIVAFKMIGTGGTSDTICENAAHIIYVHNRNHSGGLKPMHSFICREFLCSFESSHVVMKSTYVMSCNRHVRRKFWNKYTPHGNFTGSDAPMTKSLKTMDGVYPFMNLKTLSDIRKWNCTLRPVTVGTERTIEEREPIL